MVAVVVAELASTHNETLLLRLRESSCILALEQLVERVVIELRRESVAACWGWVATVRNVPNL